MKKRMTFYAAMLALIASSASGHVSETLVNVASSCSSVEASYTAPWNNLNSIYDGVKGHGELANNQTWGSWSENRPSSQWLQYNWPVDVTVSGASVWFWTDTETAGSGVNLPDSWSLQYWDASSGLWKDVALVSGGTYPVGRTSANSVSFEPVSTTRLRLLMQARGDGSSHSALGVTEWEVMGEPFSVVSHYGDYPIHNVDFSQVHLTDGFWLPRMEQNQRVTIPIAIDQCYKTNRVLNFQKAAAILRGENIGYFDTECTFDDTDIYKILEGMAYSVQSKPNAELDSQMDELIAIIASAQEPDGYLYTARTAGNPAGMHQWVGANRWEKDPDLSHELYNCGHLYEAAVAHYISTGKRTLLDVAIKNADLLVRDFLKGGLAYEPGHQIVEMGLVKMYRVTGNEDYLKLAKYFLDLRGDKGVMRNEYSQSHKRVVEQDEAVGHAVRAVYMYSGMADIAAIMGDADYLNAVDRLWNNVVGKKYYITGGIGARHSGEAFGVNYELPNQSAYCETCAAIGNVYWNWRMFLLHGDSKYYDVIERTLYNGVISGISITGDHFFYPNPLASDGTYERSAWFGCACCPSNLCRFTASVPGYVYAHHADSVYVNLYMQGQADIQMEEGTIKLSQTAEFPWKGNVSVRVEQALAGNKPFAIMLRLPGWANGRPVPSDLYRYVNSSTSPVVVKVNGVPVDYDMIRGYMVIKRQWNAGDVVAFELPMDTHFVVANSQVKDDEGLVAMERGPVVYCLEAADNENIQSGVVDDDDIVKEEWTEGMNGLMRLKVMGAIAYYGSSGEPELKETQFTAIPYYAWANRGKQEMKVWIPMTAEKAAMLLGDVEKTDTLDYDVWEEPFKDYSGIGPYDSQDIAVPRKTIANALGLTSTQFIHAYAAGKIIFSAIEPSGKVVRNSTANDPGHWFDKEGKVVTFDSGTGKVFSEFHENPYRFSIGQHPNRCSVGDKCVVMQAFTYIPDVAGEQMSRVVVRFTLHVVEDATGIGNIQASGKEPPKLFYNIQGVRLTHLEHGINIVRKQNGTVIKIYLP